jgi:hypothetical protein
MVPAVTVTTAVTAAARAVTQFGEIFSSCRRRGDPAWSNPPEGSRTQSSLLPTKRHISDYRRVFLDYGHMAQNGQNSVPGPPTACFFRLTMTRRGGSVPRRRRAWTTPSGSPIATWNALVRRSKATPSLLRASRRLRSTSSSRPQRSDDESSWRERSYGEASLTQGSTTDYGKSAAVRTLHRSDATAKRLLREGTSRNFDSAP